VEETKKSAEKEISELRSELSQREREDAAIKEKELIKEQESTARKYEEKLQSLT
jgi:hypothetical protein